MRTIAVCGVMAMALYVLFATVAAVRVTTEPSDGFLASGTVSYVENYDPAGIQVFTISFGQANGTITLMADGDLPIAAYLRGRVKQRVSVEVK